MKLPPTIVVGTAGEHLVCADLISHGYFAFLTSAGLPYDVIADVDGILLRIQVKSTMAPKPRKRPNLSIGRPVYIFNFPNKKSCDIVACVALDIKAIGYIAAADCCTKIDLDGPGERIYPNAKGQKSGCRKFESLSLAIAVERFRSFNSSDTRW